MPTPESNLLDAARAYLSRRQGSGWRICRIVLECEGPDGMAQDIVLRQGSGFSEGELSGQDARPPVQPDARPARTLTPTMQAVLDVLAAATSPLKGEAIARRAHKGYSGYFRGVLGEMVRTGVLVKVEQGYWIADRPVPGRTAG